MSREEKALRPVLVGGLRSKPPRPATNEARGIEQTKRGQPGEPGRYEPVEIAMKEVNKMSIQEKIVEEEVRSDADSSSITLSEEMLSGANGGPDPFDPASLRLSQDFAATAGVEKLLTRVPVRKPERHEFVRTHGSADHRLDIAMVELKADHEFYLLMPVVAAALPGEWQPYRLFTTINRQGVVFLWPCRLPDTERPNPWHETLLEAADLARSNWIRVSANMHLGGYEIARAVGELPEPVWPPHAFRKLLEIAFGKKLVTDLDHPLVGRLTGRD